jgi:hypothetical protein
MEAQQHEDEMIWDLIDLGVAAEREEQQQEQRQTQRQVGDSEEESFDDFWETIDIAEAERLEREELSQRQMGRGRPGSRLTTGQKKRVQLREELFASVVVQRRGN